MKESINKLLEQYTIRCPQETLIVSLKNNRGEDEVLIYKGFSSSLMHSTSFDPDTPLITEEDEIVKIDRIANPYDPEAINYLQRGLSWEEMNNLLSTVGLY